MRPGTPPAVQHQDLWRAQAEAVYGAHRNLLSDGISE